MSNKEVNVRSIREQAEVRKVMSNALAWVKSRDMGALNLVIQGCPSSEIGKEFRSLFWGAISIYINSGTMPVLTFPEKKNDTKTS